MTKVFVKTHEWFEKDGDTATVGISKFAAAQLGDVTYIELPSVGAVYKAGELIGSIESVKAASDLFTPIGGTVTAVNKDLVDQPELVNADPEGKAWLFKLDQLTAPEADAMDAEAYEAFTKK